MDQLLIQQKLLNGLGFTQFSSPMKPCLTQVRNIEVDQFCLESFTEFMSTSDNTPSGHGKGCVALGIRFVRQPCNTTTLPLNKQAIFTHNWICVRKKNFHTWYKSLMGTNVARVKYVVFCSTCSKEKARTCYCGKWDDAFYWCILWKWCMKCIVLPLLSFYNNSRAMK